MDILESILEVFMHALNPLYTYGQKIWVFLMELSGLAAGQTPESFSSGAWTFTVDTLYPWMLGISAVLLNLFFCVGLCRQMSNLKQNFTLEIFVEFMIRVFIANSVLQGGIILVQGMFSIAAQAGSGIMAGTRITFEQVDFDAGAVLFYFLLGIIYFAVCLTSGGMIFLAVYGRFLQLYLLVFSMPVAVSTVAGGQGISSTAYAWLRTFLAKTFSIVIIAAAVAVSSRLCGGIDFLSMSEGAMDGMLEAVQNIFVMVLLASSVTGADAFMRRVFAL